MPDNIQDNFNSGFIKIYRSIKKNWIWEDAEKLKWWLDILLEVNYSDKRVPMGGEVIDCKRGQSINSLETWAKRWRVDKSKVRRFFQLLKSDKMILLENVKKTTRLTVCNYDTYNDPRINSETIVNQSRINVESIATPNNKEKKEKKEEERESADKNDFLTNQSWKEQFCMAKNISMETLTALQTEWLKDVELRGKSVDSYKEYFTNYYNKYNPKPKGKKGKDINSFV